MKGLSLFPLDADLRLRRGLLLLAQGKPSEAAAPFEDLLQRFRSAADGISGYLARHNLAMVYEELGQWRNAERHWRAVLDERPKHEPAMRGLVHAPQQQGKYNQAAAIGQARSADSRK